MEHLNKDVLGVILRQLPPYMVPMMASMRTFHYAAIAYMKEMRYGIFNALHDLTTAARSDYAGHVNLLEWYMGKSKTKGVHPALSGQIEAADEPVLKLYFAHGFHQMVREYDIAHRLIMAFKLIVDQYSNEWYQYRGLKWMQMVEDDFDSIVKYANEKLSPSVPMTAASVIECLRLVVDIRIDDDIWSDQRDEMISFDNGISLVENHKRIFVTSYPGTRSRVTCGNEYRKVVKDIKNNWYLSMFKGAADAEYAFEVMKEWMTVSWEHRLPTFIAVDDEEKALDFFKSLFGDYFYPIADKYDGRDDDWQRVGVVRRSITDELREFCNNAIYLSGTIPVNVTKAHVFTMFFGHLTEPITKKQCTAFWSRIMAAKILRWARCRRVEVVAPHHQKKIIAFLDRNVIRKEGSFLTMTDIYRRFVDEPIAGFPYLSQNDLTTILLRFCIFEEDSRGRSGLLDCALSKLL